MVQWDTNKNQKPTIQDMEHSVLFSIQQTETQYNPGKKIQ